MNGQECRIKTIEVDGRTYNRLSLAIEPELPPTCHDCGVRQGGLHHAFCCLDFCPVDESHGQTLMCGHGIHGI
jgi:hypothetical protein